MAKGLSGGRRKKYQYVVIGFHEGGLMARLNWHGRVADGPQKAKYGFCETNTVGGRTFMTREEAFGVANEMTRTTEFVRREAPRVGVVPMLPTYKVFKVERVL